MHLLWHILQFTVLKSALHTLDYRYKSYSCEILHGLSNRAPLQVILISNEIPFLFLLLVRGVNLIAYLDDEFGVRLASAANLVLSVFFASALGIGLDGEEFINYRFCSQCMGKEHNFHLFSHRIIHIFVLFSDSDVMDTGLGDGILSCFLAGCIVHHFFAGVAVGWHKRRIGKSVQPQVPR